MISTRVPSTSLPFSRVPSAAASRRAVRMSGKVL